MTLLFSALFLVATLGYLTQTTGLCMVRGVKEWLAGNPGFLLAILCSGVLTWIASLSAHYIGGAPFFRVFEPNRWFAIGGLLFGLGTAFNQGCGISTLSRLASGDLQLSTTPLGWLVGWCTLAHWRPELNAVELPPPTIWTYGLLVAISFAVSIWTLKGDPQRKTLWFGMMGIGLLAGFLYLYEPGWPPSELLQDLSAAILHGEHDRWPELPRYYLVFALLFGMSLAAVQLRQFKLRLASRSSLLLHLLAGILMGVGASLAMGGNDSQLLLAMPAFSPAGLVAVPFMLLGILLGLKIRAKLTSSYGLPLG